MNQQDFQHSISGDAYQDEVFKIQLEIQQQAFRHISQEIHSNIGQILSLVRLQLSTIQQIDREHGLKKIDYSKELLDGAIDDLRQLSQRLDLDFLKQHSLTECLRLQMSYAEKPRLYPVEYQAEGDGTWLTPNQKFVIFRIAQEAITDFLKNISKPTVTLNINCNCEEISLRIITESQDFIPDDSSIVIQPEIETLIQRLHRRAAMIGANLILHCKPGKSTTLHLTYKALVKVKDNE